ncbi:MAG: RNA 2',3'-cyclic phosphodiesterase [Candidatus Omnitrophota bacterium]
MNYIRTFIAIELSQKAKDEISRIISVLKKTDVEAKWVRPGTVHITLRFLGSIDEDRIAGIETKLKKIASEADPFKIMLSNISVFPNWRRPKVVWVGAEDQNSEIQELHSKIDDVLEKESFDKTAKPFETHITLCRLKSGKNVQQLKEAIASITVSPIITKISKIILFRSDLTSKGAIHTPLVEFPF